MRKTHSVLLAASLVLAGCGGWSNSWVNPTNWFGSSREIPVEGSATPVNPLVPSRKSVFARPEAEDYSLPIAKVTALRIEPTSTGAIIYAEGVAGRQGPYDTELRPVSSEEEIKEGVLALSFRVVYPPYDTPAGSELSRTIHQAHTLSRQDLQGVKVVRLIGRDNALESRRR